ncbi:MAG: hypothetical protein ACXWZF_12620 [Actinomycetota bacterium]
MIRDNLEWFLARSGAFALFVAGLLAGMLTVWTPTGSTTIGACARAPMTASSTGTV